MESEKPTVGRITQLTNGDTSTDFARRLKEQGITISGSLKLPSGISMISIPKTTHDRLLADSERCERLMGVAKRLVEDYPPKALTHVTDVREAYGIGKGAAAREILAALEVPDGE